MRFSADCKATPFQDSCWLVTTPRVADVAGKQRLATAYHAGLVDMEAAAIARLAQTRGIPFYCLKGISDGYRDRLPDFNPFITEDGQFMLTRFVVFVLLRPWYWPALMRMGENSKSASRSISDSLLEFFDERGPMRDRIRERNGNPNDGR
jgi:adenosylhomocysteine nucleosidase